MAGKRLCHFGNRCNKGSACPFAHLNTNQSSQDGIVQRSSRQSSRPPGNPFGPLPNQDSARPRYQSTDRSSGGTRPSSSTPYFANKSRGMSMNRETSSASGQLSNTRGPCRFGAACRNQPNCPFDHTPSDERTSSSLVDEYMDQFQDEYQDQVPLISAEHGERIDKLEEQLANDETGFENVVLKNLLQEHQLQLKIFHATVDSLSAASLPTDDYTARHRLGAIRREIKRLRAHLPIYARREDLLERIRSTRVVILKADTGSGKSTQLVQYLIDGGFAERGKIVCTQPRRLAVRTLASRVAEEFGCKVDDEIGFRVGGMRPRASDRTKVHFVTDSMLLNEYVDDPKLSQYSIVIIDEAHERRVDTDLLFGVMKLCLRQRADLKLIVMSATLDIDLLSDYYPESSVIEVAGRTYPIEDEYTIDDVENYVDASIAKALEIHHSHAPGDILIFLTGPDEIERAVEEVQGKVKDTAIVLPLHGKLNEKETQQVFVPAKGNKRKIVFSTNVAETSVTIDGIRHVIDSGMVKEMMWDEKRRMQVLKIGVVTQSSVKQRRGRAGRTSPGKCYHLYTKEMYDSFDVCPRAEILCIQPSIAVLKVKYLGVVEKIEDFDWLEAPSAASIADAVQTLEWLEAVDRRTGQITDLGRKMAKMGCSPMLSAMILRSTQMPCTSQVIALAGMLTVAPYVWWRSKDLDLRKLANEKRACFACANDQGGDFLQLLKIFLEWEAVAREKRSDWCRKNMINGKAMNMALDFSNETARHLGDVRLAFHSITFDQAFGDQILTCVAAGYFQNLAVSNGTLKAGYRLIAKGNVHAQVHQWSTLAFAEKPAKFILYDGILNINGTDRLTSVCPVQLDCLPRSWLSSLPHQPDELVFQHHTFSKIGPSLMLACLGKRCAKKQQLEDALGAVLDVNYPEATLTVWCSGEKLLSARRELEKRIQLEREKLIREVEEYEIISNTRILLSQGGQPVIVLVNEEYLKVMVRGLPTDITEEDVERKFQLYGRVRCVNLIQIGSDGTSASVIYYRRTNARAAVVGLTNEMLNGRQLTVSPSYNRTSAHSGAQQCKLDALWFLTESECSAKLIFTEKADAQAAVQVMEGAFNCQCLLHMNSVHPTIRCNWPYEDHIGRAFVNFETVEQARVYLRRQTIGPMDISSSRNNPLAIFVKNILKTSDEDDLKAVFPESKTISLMYPSKPTRLGSTKKHEEYIRQIFGHYKSFLPSDLMVKGQLFRGKVEALVHFTDENEAETAIREMNGRTGYMQTGKLRLALLKPIANNKTTPKHDQYFLNLKKLPPHIHEENIRQLLIEKNLADNFSYARVSREKLPEEQSLPKSESEKLQLTNELQRLRSLFSAPGYFRSEPDIHIRSATNDGRVIASIIYNNADDVTRAMQLSKDPKNKDLFQFGKHQLILIPRNDHVIGLHRSLVKAIPDKIQKALDEVRGMGLDAVQIYKRQISINNDKITRIHIQSTDKMQMIRARATFDRLMKGLEFRFNAPTWAPCIFSPEGRQFLQSLQESTHTYIWYKWSSNFVRIFGSDQSSNEAYRKIDEFIQEQLSSAQNITSIPIPPECLRQCLKKIEQIKAFGNEEVSIVINILKKTIVVRGERSLVSTCGDRLRQYLAGLPEQSLSIKATGTIRCPLCCDTCESPYTLQQCGHTFCRICLQHMFTMQCDPTLSEKAFLIKCPGERCDVPCLIRDIKSILGPDGMRKLSKAAFQIYLKQKEHDLAQCVGIDCIQVYRPSKNPSKYTCDQCVKEYCVACQVEYHDGISCAEHQKLMNEKRDQELLTENLGLLPIQKCPKCSVLIERFAGCNAMKCTQCNIAFCWRCRAIDQVDVHPHFNDKSTTCFGKTFD